MEKNMEVLLVASREVGLEVNTEQPICLSHHKNVEQNHNLMIYNKSFENVAKFEYFGTTVTNKMHSQRNSE
jgi:hypothetical protein